MSDDKPKVFANDPIQIATENQRSAVRTAIAHLESGGPHVDPYLRALHLEMALDVLVKSVRKCALLDNRPLDADRVHARHLAVLALMFGDEAPEEVA